MGGPRVAARIGEADAKDGADLRVREDVNDGVVEYEGAEQARVKQRELDEDVPAEGMRYTDDRSRHLAAEVGGHEQKISGVVSPGRVVAEQLLIELVTVVLMRHVGDPNTTDTEALGLVLGV
ncbi:hypothetical protein NPX13_g5878 [Xylaria arbuscula]|uniref:Uncharacterized protein n=1 Tax=Xylaria arbuscula TaxID=114810 RepID=A0A9W8NDQ9_9PEZI|nr:hypothetical protein NPX13_g5878 [Xylaria arbuscula]